MVKKLTSTFNHRQLDGKPERGNRTLFTRVQFYIAEHQKDWDHIVEPLTNAFNTQTHSEMRPTPLSVVLARHLPNPMPFNQPTTFPVKATSTSTNTLQWFLLAEIHAMRSSIDSPTKQALQRYKMPFNSSRGRQSPFLVNDFAYVNRTLLAINPAGRLVMETYSKFLTQTIGPLGITAVGQQS